MAEASPLRLYVTEPLSAGTTIALGREQSHYLINVMRRAAGAPVDVFNGIDGEWRTTIDVADRKASVLDIQTQTRAQENAPDIWLLFAPLKKDRTDFVVEKATELGASKIVPVITARTQTNRVNRDRLAATAVEAAEQSRRLDVPDVDDAVQLDRLLDGWPEERMLIFLDETGGGQALGSIFQSNAGACALLIGPEGGFAPEEIERLRALPFCCGADLGPRILRAETAAVAALAIRQAVSDMIAQASHTPEDGR